MSNNLADNHHDDAECDHHPAARLTSTPIVDTRVRKSVPARIWAAMLTVWSGVAGIAPHVLHHVGPLAGAALLAGTGGTVLFAVIALVVSIPFLLRMYRRFHTWIAPTITLAVMTVMFLFSTFVLGPIIRGDTGETTPQQPGQNEQPAPQTGHNGHVH